MTKGLFSPQARWIWDGGDRLAYHKYLRMRRTFTAGKSVDTASLLITADALYQVGLNGRCVGHGPAKSAEGTRSVDRYEIVPFLTPGENTLEVLVMSIGVNTMTYCLGRAGLIFEIELDGRRIVSDAKTQVRRESARLRPTVRRWILPCIEDVDTTARTGHWHPARVVESTAKLYPRRVPLPTREEVYPRRLAWEDRVDLPNFSVSFRIKPALVDGAEAKLHNTFSTEATFRLPIFSPKAQNLEFTPTLGNSDWSFSGKKLFTAAGWGLWDPAKSRTKIRLKAGRNELVARHFGPNHFEDINLAGFVDRGLRVGPLAVERKDGVPSSVEPSLFANAHDLVVGAKVSPDGAVRRTIWDLGCVLNGWIAFDARGRQGDRLLLAFFEGMENGARPRFQWANAGNNALTYHLSGGRQHFESFFPYGVRYIAVHEIGGPVDISGLRILKATCSRKAPGTFQTDDPQMNGVYRICEQTVESATDDTFTDCPTFEQVNWNFDNRMAALADQLIGDNGAINRNSMQLFAEDPHCRGLVNSQTPSGWRTLIPMWSYHWIFWCRDYYWHTGDVAFLRRMLPTVRQGIREAIGKIGRDGLVEFPGAWHFVEWAQGRDDDHAINTVEQAALLEVMEVADRLASVLGQAQEFALARANLRRAIRRHLWNPARRCFVDSRHEDGTPSKISSQVSNAVAALYGAGDAAWSRRMAETLARGRSSLSPLGSPVGLFYIMELWDHFGFRAAIFKAIRQRWGAMLAAGDGTTWETFAEFGHGSWPTRSRCHPYSAYVVKYLVKYILGLEIIAPGFAQVRIKPLPPEGMNEASGTIPTPHGPLRISWTRRAGKIDLDLEAPRGVKVL